MVTEFSHHMIVATERFSNLISLLFAKGILIEMKDIKVNWVHFATQAQGVGGRRHKGKMATGVFPKSKVSMLISQILTSPTPTPIVVVDVVGLATIKTPMICKEHSHLQHMFDTHAKKVIFI